ncbi:hypothetical protein BP6252_01430 [Coleophoma cylindrospora]|uniref:Uncharacterized protein n=1 Tax=Coleophoma cylindrospora TaxID=1849047 RepID=A0A3D8SUF0_9HELO|nr:hypothetical protein BP6252_01430 [Coleophoma cylindrospora]
MSSALGYSQPKSRSRTSSPHPNLATARRPKLVRASATAPSVAISNASRKDLSNHQSARAAAILSRVASYSSQQTSPGSTCLTPGQRSLSMERRKEPFVMASSQSGSYFSFPSFEDFQDYQDDLRRSEHRNEKT